MMTNVDLIRHGEPVGGRKYRGQSDDALSESGWNQMWAAVEGFSDWQQIVTSPLARCSDFAEALGAKLQIPVTSDERLKEIAFGIWEGKLPSEICADDPQRIFRFRCDPSGNTPDGAEAIADFYQRVGAGFHAMLESFQGQHILVVAHAGVIRMVLCHALGIPVGNAYRINVGNAALTRIRFEQQGDQSLATLMFHDGNL